MITAAITNTFYHSKNLRWCYGHDASFKQYFYYSVWYPCLQLDPTSRHQTGAPAAVRAPASMAQVGANMEYQEYKWAYSIMDSSK